MDLHLSTNDFELKTDGYYEGTANYLRRSIDELTKDVEKAEKDLDEMHRNIRNCEKIRKENGYPPEDLWNYSGHGHMTNLIVRLRDLIDRRKGELQYELENKRRVYVNLIKKKEKSDVYEICKNWLENAGVLNNKKDSFGCEELDGSIRVLMYRWYFAGLLKHAIFNHPEHLQNYTVHNISDTWLQYCKENSINISTGIDTIFLSKN